MIIANYLKMIGKLPENLSTSLLKLAEHFGIENKNAHNAKYDTNMTIAVLKKLKSI